MNAIRWSLRPSRSLTAVLATAALLGLASLPAAAQGWPPVYPTGGLWCGLTDEGYGMFMQLTPDARFVEWVDIRTPFGQVSTREQEVRGISRAQVADEKFIFRQQREETRCEPDDNGREERCRTVTIDALTVRGIFHGPSTARGSFAAQQVYDPHAGGRSGRGVRRSRLLNGSYDAWPVGMAPCP
jgi:hypothetical protein